jgi:PAS domain S-box-containing protein
MKKFKPRIPPWRDGFRSRGTSGPRSKPKIDYEDEDEDEDDPIDEWPLRARVWAEGVVGSLCPVTGKTANRFHPCPLPFGRRMLLLCVGSWLALAASPPAHGQDTRPLLFVGDKDYPPLTYLDNQQPAGMAVDVAKALSGPMKRPIRIELMNWDAAQQKVLNGEADAVLEMSDSPERQKLYDFASFTFTHEFGFVVRSTSLSDWTVSDLKGRKVGVTSGGFPRAFLETQPDLHLIIINDYEDGFKRLSAGTLDAVAADLWVAAYLIERRGVSGVSIVDKPFATVHAAIAVKKGNSALLADITRGIETLRADGTLAKIKDNWRPEEVVFASRQKIKGLVALVIGAFLAMLIAAMLLWVLTLKRQIRLRRQIESALRENEERYRNLTEAAFEGIGISEGGRILDANEQMLKMFGYERNEFIGMKVTDLVAPESQAIVAEAIQSGRESIYEHRLLRKDGSSFFAEARAKMVPSGGRTLRMTALRDITERKLSEELNKTQSEVLEMITRGEPLLKTMDVMLRKIEAQLPEMLCSILLLDADGLRVRHGAAPSLPPDYIKGIDGQPIGPCAGSCGTAAYRGEAVYVSDIATDPLWVDYRELALAHGLRACWSTPIFNAQRKVLGTLAIYYRKTGLPTEQHRQLVAVATHTAAICINKHNADRALQESEARFRALVEYSPDCIAVAVNERLVYLNPAGAKLIGAKDANEVLGRSTYDFVPVELHETMRRRREKVLAESVSSPVMEFALLRLDGSLVTIESQAVPFVYAGQTAILNLMHDVTDRKRMEAERSDLAARERKAREEFTRLLIMSQEAERQRIAGELHDGIGQNLSIIKNRARLAQQQPPPTAAGHLEAIERVATDAIAETRNLARNLRPLHIQQVGLTDSLRELIREASESTPIRLERRVENVDDIFKDEAATNVYRVVQEALSNLIKHSSAQQASVTVERDVRSVRLRIADDGVGFEVKQATAKGGLGLTSMTERVSMLGGTMRIESAPGRGTQLMVELPFVEREQETPAETAT